MVKINALSLENVKRIRAVELAPAENGLTVIGGANGQGKTSVLDAIAWTLGGERFAPSTPQREGSCIPPYLKVVLSNGLVVERRGKNSELKVTDPSGRRAGQTLLNSFIGSFALDLPRFLNAPSREKADTLLRIIGVKEQLAEVDAEIEKAYNERYAVGRIADQKAKYAAELPFWADVPQKPVSAAELISRQQEILARNGENQRKRLALAALERRAGELRGRVARLEAELQAAKEEYAAVSRDVDTAQKTVAQLQDESTAALEADLRDVETLNAKVRDNMDKERASAEAARYGAQYKALSEQIDELRRRRTGLLENADLPLPGLSVENGELTLNGRRWDCMSGAEQLTAATAIVRKVNPECGFVLLDKLEQMDTETLEKFGRWLESEGLQAIATRVSTGGECQIIIEDGYVKGAQSAPAWKAGEF